MMDDDLTKKIMLYIVLFFIGLLTMILQVFIFEYPDGFIGFIICLASVYLMLGSIIKLCKTSKIFKDTILFTILDMIFWLP